MGLAAFNVNFLNADVNAAKPQEPGTKIQASRVLSILVLGSMGLAAFDLIFYMQI